MDQPPQLLTGLSKSSDLRGSLSLIKSSSMVEFFFLKDLSDGLCDFVMEMMILFYKEKMRESGVPHRIPSKGPSPWRACSLSPWRLNPRREVADKKETQTSCC